MNELIYTLAGALVLILLVGHRLRHPAGAPARQIARHIAAQAVATAATGGAGTEKYRLDDRWPYPRGVLSYPAGPGTSACEQWWSELIARLAGDEVDLAEGSPTHGDLTNILQARVAASRIASSHVRPDGYRGGALDTDAILHDARQQASEILADHQPWVDAVAAALLCTGRLTGVDVMMLGAVVRDAGRPAGAAA